MPAAGFDHQDGSFRSRFDSGLDLDIVQGQVAIFGSTRAKIGSTGRDQSWGVQAFRPPHQNIAAEDVHVQIDGSGDGQRLGRIFCKCLEQGIDQFFGRHGVTAVNAGDPSTSHQEQSSQSSKAHGHLSSRSAPSLYFFCTHGARFVPLRRTRCT